MMNSRTFHNLGLLIALGMAGRPLPAAESTAKPNVLFAIADDWSHGHTSAAGCRWINTPGFDRVAKAGVRFTNAFTPNAKCAPSRAILLTGRNSWQLEEAANHVCYFPAKFKTFAESLSEQGYFVGCTGKGWGPGVANDAQGKPRQMTGKPYNRRKATPPARQISNNDYAGNFADFLNAATDKPWCFWYGATEPHRGYQYGVGVSRGKKLSDIDHVPGYWPDNEAVRNDLLDYAVEVEHFDSHLSRMLALLEERGLLENTLVVVTSDHGMPFPRCKGQAYNQSNHVPLAISWKAGIKTAGRVVEDYVSFVDVAPTLIEVAGLTWEQTGMAPTPGRSLTDVLFSNKSERVNLARNHVLIGKERHDVGRPDDVGYPIRGIVLTGFLYLKNYETDRWPAGNPEAGYLNCDGGITKTEVLKSRTKPDQKKFWDLCFGKRGSEELYDLETDPDCLHNLVDDPECAKLKEKMKGVMVELLTAQDDPRMRGQGDVFDKYPYANAEGRDFYNRLMKGEPVKAGWVNPSDFERVEGPGSRD